MQTIYFASSESDGYISTFFYADKELRDFHYNMNTEGFGATDSDGSFRCMAFDEGSLTSLLDVVSMLVDTEEDLKKLEEKATEYLSGDNIDKFNQAIEEVRQDFLN